MINTGWHQRDVDMSRHAIPYAYLEGQFRPYLHYGLATWPDGGLRTTVIDLGQFVGMLTEGGALRGVRILKTSTIRDMLQPQQVTLQSEQLPSGSTGSAQAIFWVRVNARDGHAVFYRHTGGDPGVSTFISFDPDSHIGVLGFANTDGTEAVRASLGQIMERLFAAAHRTSAGSSILRPR